MFYSLVSTATVAAGAAVAPNPKGVALFGGIVSLIPLFLLIYIVYDIVQRRKITKKHKEMLASIKEGDKVVTIGGLRGEIAAINEKTFELKVDKGIRLEFERRALARLDK